jgi:hypothetical protein
MKMIKKNPITVPSRVFVLASFFTAATLITNSFSLVTAQSLVPGIHGMSIVQGVKFTWVIISSDKEVSVNLRYLGNGTSPPVTIVATALTNPTQSNNTQNQSSGPTTMGGSQILNAGWASPNSLTIKIEGNSSLYDADLVTVVASPYTGG